MSEAEQKSGDEKKMMFEWLKKAYLDTLSPSLTAPQGTYWIEQCFADAARYIMLAIEMESLRRNSPLIQSLHGLFTNSPDWESLKHLSREMSRASNFEELEKTRSQFGSDEAQVAAERMLGRGLLGVPPVAQSPNA